MTTPRTGAQRQASHKARMQAAGLVRISAWVRPDEVQAVRELIAWVRETCAKSQPDAKIVPLLMSENG